MIIYHPGTGTYLDANECVMIDTDEEVDDFNVEQMIGQHGFHFASEKFAVVTGNPLEGLNIHGPFYSLEAGLDWADDFRHGTDGHDWYITLMDAPS